ncbi:hypothetical protein [Undibacterium rugosum]|uniref:hypothetical protein n=1 Tax=Undibacterium rugosum TaxID=2762291 RepID=UPI001B8372A2|nr:hypothetical protein [Undibacterium rugosum]MBR7779532.1 hypothetical protein [Undibacterium rugosum]
MSTYIVEVDPQLTLDDISLAIAGEEATGAEFQRVALSFHENRITNLVTFNDLPPGKRPTPQILFLAEKAAAPAGKKLLWAGVMLVSGTNTAVKAYR